MVQRFRLTEALTVVRSWLWLALFLVRLGERRFGSAKAGLGLVFCVRGRALWEDVAEYVPRFVACYLIGSAPWSLFGLRPNAYFQCYDSVSCFFAMCSDITLCVFASEAGTQ